MAIKMNIIHNSHPQYRFNNFHIWNGKKPFLISLSYFHVYKWSERSMWFQIVHFLKNEVIQLCFYIFKMALQLHSFGNIKVTFARISPDKHTLISLFQKEGDVTDFGLTCLIACDAQNSLDKIRFQNRTFCIVLFVFLISILVYRLYFLNENYQSFTKI